MKKLLSFAVFSAVLAGYCGIAAADNGGYSAEIDEGFVSIFNGKNTDGWVANKAYVVKTPGVLEMDPAIGGGNLYTEKDYDNFILRFEFCLPENANNGLGIRCERGKDAAYYGMELQILDDGGSAYYDSRTRLPRLAPYQYHGSVYGIAAAKRDSYGKAMKATAGNGSFLKPCGEWNFQEVRAIGSKIQVILNGIMIVDTDISKYKGDGDTPDKRKHPGLHNAKGAIAWCGHGANVKWRNIKIKEVSKDYKFEDTIEKTPEGFTKLFDGSSFANWKGVTTKNGFDNPKKRQSATAEERAAMQKEADELMKKHWHFRDGEVLFFDGFRGGYSLATAKDYKDFEMWVDWRLLSIKGDSGLYLRGSPQVQIWDAHNQWNIGSGGLYNNQKNPSKPLCIADKQIGEWNRFYIKMVGEKVTVKLNGKLVVDNVTLENFWDRKIPIFPVEQIELQCHGDPLEFRNIFIKEL